VKITSCFFYIRALTLIVCPLANHALAQTRESPPVVIRVAQGLSEDSHLGRAVTLFAERVARDSAGRLTVKPIHNGQAGTDPKAMQDAIEGKLEIFVGSTTTIVPAYKPLAIWDTPFLFANYAEAHAVLDSKVGQSLLQGVSESGLVGLAYWENGFRNMTNNLRPVTRVEDFAGIRLRTMPSEAAINTFNRLGVDAKPLQFAEVRAALQNGTFDGQENPYPTIVSAKIHEVQKYLTVTNHMYTPYGVMASRKWWLTLTAADQKIIRDAAWDTRLFQREESRKAADAALVSIKASGVKVDELAIGERSRISHRLEKVNAVVAANVGLPLWIETHNQIYMYRSRAK